MKELPPDNIGLLRHLQASDFPSAIAPLATSSRLRPREVNSLLSWAVYFTSYVAILAESHPDRVKSRLAYFTLIIAEARYNGGDGWQSHHAIFRQNAAEDKRVDWTRLDTSLRAATCTFVVQSSGTGSVCLYCSSCDHSPRDCALRQSGGTWSTSSLSQGGAQPTTRRERDNPKSRPLPASFPVCNPKSRLLPASFPVCIRWNKGNCYSPTCCYRHWCATLPGSHQAYLCPSAPPGSFYKHAVPKAQTCSASVCPLLSLLGANVSIPVIVYISLHNLHLHLLYLFWAI